MLDWATIYPELRSLITDLSQASVSAIVSERKRPFVNPTDKFQIILRVTSLGDLAEDEYRYEEVSGDVHQQVYGQRKVVLQVRVEHYEDEDEGWSFTIAERIRTRLYRTASLVRLREINCSLIDNGPILNFSVPEADDHILGVAVFDFNFQAAFLDTDANPVGFIDKIELTSHVQGADGVELPVPPNVTELLIDGS